MKSTTAYNHQRRLLLLLRSIWSSTRISHRHHMAHIEAMGRLWNDEGLARCPGHVKSFISGYDRALWEQHQQTAVVWRMPFNGVLYAGWDDLPEEGKEAYRSGGATGKHVYKDNENYDW